ncbi:SDR family NAD(P)-dependent oxidoreductase [Paraglaciecola aquimarina]|uniref:SDR family NAD(P)-dependent oxidoreductase n=1 Tax=Paraglaciecola algarum TaxID=3050085 RepID=A0ABS9D807_9ALTE|nr:SDR family NAD(P)-dependent oxidoreductase [Paraglaciecola sp. G1-23]MCF2949107.1 SDR family NAD(P)-dependent oxidoreductase [Paraglaciecola sp. G1-23]
MLNSKQSVVITGANRGIGLGLCSLYLHYGWQVIATHRQGAISDALQELNKQYSSDLTLVELDVCDEQSIQHFAAKVCEEWSHISVLINNAGVSIDSKFGEWNQATFLNNFNANMVGPALVIQALSGLFEHNTKVIQISTGLASLQENIGADEPFDAYAVSKISLNLLTKRLANKAQTKSAIYCAISPGWVNTDMGGPEAPTSVAEVAQQISLTIESLTLEQSGSFLDSTGATIPW